MLSYMGAKVRPDPETHIRVWDLPVRLFHWSIVLLLCLSWFSADQGYMRVHLVSGLSLLALLLFRIAWGLVGSTTARFRNFLHPPRRVAGYLKGLAGGDKIFYAGHNPAGGLMVVALIAVLLAQVASGLFANDGVRFHGPLALLVSEDVSTRLTDIHGLIFDFILVLVWCHVVAVGFYLLVKGDNLVWPMVTGKKHRSLLPAELNIVFTRLYIAVLLLAVSAGIAAWVLIQGEFVL
jgi:cytochrome b